MTSPKQSWWQRLARFVFGKHLANSTIRNSKLASLHLEQLEERSCPSTVIWDGSGNDNLWSNHLNWSTGTVPGSADDVLINPGNITIVNDLASTAVNSIQSDANLVFNHSLSLAANSAISGSVSLAGSLNLPSGVTLSLGGGGDIHASISLASSAVLQLQSGIFTVDSGTSFSGAGTLEVTSAYAGSACADIPAGFSAPNVLLDDGGIIDGSGTFTVSNSMTYAGGTLTGSGTLDVVAGATLLINSSAQRNLEGGYTLQNDGSALWTDDGTIMSTTGSGLFQNNGSLSIQGDGTLRGYTGSLTLDNSSTGTITKSASSGTTILNNVALDNYGSIDVQSGTLELDGGGTSTATVTIESGATLAFNGPSTTYILSAPSTTSGAGTVNITAGTVQVNGSYSVALTEVGGLGGYIGTFEVDANKTIP